MALVRWDPWHDMLGSQREWQDLMRRFFGDWAAPVRSNGGAEFAPAVEAFSRGDDLVVRAELPGVDPEKDVDITLEQGVLTIRGERRQEETDRGEQYFRSERRYGAFQRQLVLPEGTKADDISASYKDGILEVVVPKAAKETEARKIPVSVGGKDRAVLTEGHKE